jgi:aryl-alcohol dehydrogenase-like predicted oxidoreductase
VLTGKYNDGVPDGSRLSLEGYKWLKENLLSEDGMKNIEKVKRLTTVAEELGISMAALALAWVVKNPNVSTVITGASKPEQVKENIKVIDYVDLLTEDVMNRIEVILNNKPEPEKDWKA